MLPCSARLSSQGCADFFHVACYHPAHRLAGWGHIQATGINSTWFWGLWPTALPEDLLGASHSTRSVKYLESGMASVSKNKIFQTAPLSFSNIQIFSIIHESGLSVNPYCFTPLFRGRVILEMRRPEFVGFWYCHSLAMWPGESYLMSLSLSSLIPPMELRIFAKLMGRLWEIYSMVPGAYLW